MFHQFKPEYGECPATPKSPKREPRNDLKGIPMGDGMMFTQKRIDKINAFKIEALEANIIKGGKPKTTGSHGY